MGGILLSKKIQARRNVRTVTSGATNAVRHLFRWINAAPDKVNLKKRLLIAAAVPVGVFLLGTQYPALTAGSALVALLLVCFWFSAQRPAAMTVLPEDFVRPFLLDGRTVDLVELVRHLAQKHREEPLVILTAVIAEDFGGPLLTEKQLSSLLLRHGIAHGAQDRAEGVEVPSHQEDSQFRQTHPEHSPTTEEGSEAGEATEQQNEQDSEGEEEK